MTDDTEYIEADKGRRFLLYIGVPVGVVALIIVDYFVGRETDALLAQLDTLSLEQIEQENQRLIRQLYAIVGAFTVVWLIFSVIFIRNGLKVWRTERFPARTVEAARRYTSVLPLPVTPHRRIGRKPDAAAAVVRSTARRCESLSVTSRELSGRGGSTVR